MDQLKEYAEYLEDEIEELSEISSVDIRGVQEKELEIAVDLYKMEASMISFSDIENAVKFENMSVTGGDLLENGVRRTVRVIGEFEDPLSVRDLIVKQEKGNIVYLRDIADISFKEQEKESFASAQSRKLAKSFIDLDERSREIIQRRWLTDSKTTLQELADQFGISAERVRQLEQNALKKLKLSFS